MKKNLFAAMLLFSFLNGMTQSSNSLTGRVKDSATGSPLAFVTVHLTGDSTIGVKSAFSDSSGIYHFSNIQAGKYFLTFSLAGYIKASTGSFFVSDTSQTPIMEQLLTTAVKHLSQVTVFSKKPLIEKSVDGVIYNVQQDLLAGGGTANDVLRKTPLVTVAPDGTPSIRGSSNIRVFIDDKPSDIFASSIADALQQVPAEEIVRVEVILYPSAKYDVEGTDGVINIITRKKTMNGMNGTLSTSQGNISRNLLASANIRQGKLIFNFDAGVHHYGNKNSSVMSREEFGKSLLTQNNEWTNDGKTGHAGVNIIYLIDSLKNLYGGIRYRINVNSNDRESFNDYFISDSLANSFQRNTEVENGNRVATFNAGYSGKSKNQKRELKLFTSYFNHRGYSDYELQQFRKETADYLENFDSKSGNKELTLQADYSLKIAESMNLEAGVKSSNRETNSNNYFEVFQYPPGKFEEDNARANTFDYNRAIYAGYSNFSFSMKTWQMRAGGRYEQTLQRINFKGTSVSVPDYKNFIPSLLISKSLGQHNLKLNYNKQILRPFTFHLNPAINYTDSLNQEYGNPYLLPEVTQRYDLGYTANFKKIFTGGTLFYSRNRNSIENIRIPAENGVFVSTYQNIGKKDALGVSGNISYRDPKLTINTTLNLRYMMLKSVALQMENNGLQFNGTLNASWKFNNGYSIEGICYINTDDIRLQGRREGWKFYSLVMSRKMNNDKLTISLRGETYNRFITEDFMTTEFYQRTDTRFQNFVGGLSISWKLGKKEIKVPVIQQGSSE